MFDYKGKHTLTYTIMVSLLLHGSLLLIAIWLFQSEAPPDRSQKLLVELYGMIAERQTEAQAPAATPTPAKPVPKKEPSPREKSRTRSHENKADKLLTTESPVQVAEVEKEIVHESAPAKESNDSQLQQQKTLSVPDKEREEMKKYLIALKKKIQTHLIYPDEAKKSGYEGTSLVRFTMMENGTVRPGSLTIARSSGYAVLDSNAMKATQASAPFDRPVREMDVVIGVGFFLER